ncbi:hypothetical protein CK203_117529 [Vitis vinifera]|uniref:RanBP2-type domain-containing protein n=1 Tax=Vitis vinifera TaxID=29760 RepID=A0A438D5X9_VITVI|nr:hypothetical protein CK203_117529 [Vitis vinifera]
MSRPGDWNCRSCQHMNFQRRDSCQRCGDPKSGGGDFGSFGGRGGSSFGFTGSDVRPGTGTAMQATVELTTLLAALTASSVVHSKMSLLGATIPTCHAPEVSGSAVAAAGLGGNPVIGYAAGLDAMSTTLLAEWNVSDAMPRGT